MLPGIFIFVFLGAVALLIVGLRGRRVGDEPRCRKCKYNLNGTTSENCSECGASISARSICWGLKKTRWLSTAISLFLIVSLITCTYATYTGTIQWIYYYPYSWLRDSAMNGDKAAVGEFLRRMPLLQNSQLQELADFALQQRSRVLSGIDVGRLPANYRDWDFLLVSMYNAKLLSGEQRDTYHKQLIALGEEFLWQRIPPIDNRFQVMTPRGVPQTMVAEMYARWQSKLVEINGLTFKVERRRAVIPDDERSQSSRRSGYFDGISWEMTRDSAGQWIRRNEDFLRSDSISPSPSSRSNREP